MIIETSAADFFTFSSEDTEAKSLSNCLMIFSLIAAASVVDVSAICTTCFVVTNLESYQSTLLTRAPACVQ